MDLRMERTKRSIINSFIELRSKKPIEKITIKELSENALINKATFYAHYKDIYDLSEQVVAELAFALTSQTSILNTLFSGSRSSMLAYQLEKGLKDRIYRQYPEYKNDPEWDILLTVLIQGNFHAFLSHSTDTETNQLINIIGSINERMLAK